MEFETTDLANVVAECVRKLAPVGKAAGSRRLEVDVAAGLIVRANVDHLTAILQNLLDNAFKYNRPGGGVSIAARVDGTSAVVTVRDTGRGISKADLGLVFNRFYRARATKHIRGTGLGLPIVKGIVELHGGRIWVESVYRKGSAFHFTLPLAG
jgi:signal transduction histidine kinase